MENLRSIHDLKPGHAYKLYNQDNCIFLKTICEYAPEYETIGNKWERSVIDCRAQLIRPGFKHRSLFWNLDSDGISSFSLDRIDNDSIRPLHKAYPIADYMLEEIPKYFKRSRWSLCDTGSMSDYRLAEYKLGESQHLYELDKFPKTELPKSIVCISEDKQVGILFQTQEYDVLKKNSAVYFIETMTSILEDNLMSEIRTAIIDSKSYTFNDILNMLPGFKKYAAPLYFHDNIFTMVWRNKDGHEVVITNKW